MVKALALPDSGQASNGWVAISPENFRRPEVSSGYVEQGECSVLQGQIRNSQSSVEAIQFKTTILLGKGCHNVYSIQYI